MPHFLKLLLVVCLLLHPFLPASAQASRANTHQITFSCDNNIFLFNGEDGYYTNGVFLRYDQAGRQISKYKKLYSFEVGQMIFMAHSRKILPKKTSRFPGGIDQIDRPITGFLFGKVSRTAFLSDQKMLTLGLSVGSIGGSSLGKEVQVAWHRMIGIKAHWDWVWDYAVNSETGLNLHATFATALFDKGDFLQVTPVSQASLGTLFTNVSQGILFQFGKTGVMSRSSYWASRILNGDDAEAEIYFFYRPEIKYQLYNATIQGGMFSVDKGPITMDVEPLVITHDIGIRYARGRYCVGYHVTLQSREARGQFKPHAFANLMATCRF